MTKELCTAALIADGHNGDAAATVAQEFLLHAISARLDRADEAASPPTAPPPRAAAALAPSARPPDRPTRRLGRLSRRHSTALRLHLGRSPPKSLPLAHHRLRVCSAPPPSPSSLCPQLPSQSLPVTLTAACRHPPPARPPSTLRAPRPSASCTSGEPNTPPPFPSPSPLRLSTPTRPTPLALPLSDLSTPARPTPSASSRVEQPAHHHTHVSRVCEQVPQGQPSLRLDRHRLPRQRHPPRGEARGLEMSRDRPRLTHSPLPLPPLQVTCANVGDTFAILVPNMSLRAASRDRPRSPAEGSPQS